VKLFVSHIAEEAALGIVVKDGLEDAFSQRIEVFVSSDPRDNPGGDNWLDRIKRELKDPEAMMLISLVSPMSVREPWISIELGATWILDRAVFPLCFGGQRLEELPRPLQDFGGADLVRDDAAKRLMGAVEKATGLKAPTRWDLDAFLADMRQTVKDLNRPVKAPALAASAAPGNAMPAGQIVILRMLANLKNQNVEDITEQDAARACSMQTAVLVFHMHELVKKRMVFSSVYGFEGEHYSIAPPGSGWLIENGQMPDEP
jgi:hypothetical protein